MIDLLAIDLDDEDVYDIELGEPSNDDLYPDPYDKPIKEVALLPSRDEEMIERIHQERDRARIKDNLLRLEEAPKQL